MNLKIIKKEYARNEKYKTNTVYFEIDDLPMELHIIYLSLGGSEKLIKSEDKIYLSEEPTRRFNAFLDDKLYEQCEQLITGRYSNINFEDFKKYFMYKLYKYSRGVGLDKECLDITPEIIKRIEEA